MSGMISSFALGALLVAVPALGQSVTTTAGASMITSSTLKLAKTYSGSGFTSGFDFYTDDDPTGGYVNYMSQTDATAAGLVDVQGDGSFIMRADSSTVASGRGRDSIRISSKDKYADGVYILDLNHMPVGCGTWPAFWTVTKSGWPSGGEIDIVEGANAPPVFNGLAYNATTGYIPPTTPIQSLSRDTASLHTSDNCQISGNTYMTGQLGSSTCSAYLNGNLGCGVELGGNTTYGVDSFGSGVNQAGGGWYAMWRDIANSGGVYVYYWPRNSPNVPADVKNPSTPTTNVADWGQPGANLSIPSCRSDFNNHVIVFDLTFCGDYAGATYTTSGCPSSCSSFVMNNPGAFAEAYWSINSLRVYTASGSPAYDTILSTSAIAGIAVGAVIAVIIPLAIWWRYITRRRKRRAMGLPVEEQLPQSYTTLARGSNSNSNSRPPTTYLEGETPKGFYHDDSSANSEAYLHAPGREIAVARTSMQTKESGRSGSSSGSVRKPKSDFGRTTRSGSLAVGKTSRSESIAPRPNSYYAPGSRSGSVVPIGNSWVAPDVRKASVLDRKINQPSTSWAG